MVKHNHFDSTFGKEATGFKINNRDRDSSDDKKKKTMVIAVPISIEITDTYKNYMITTKIKIIKAIISPNLSSL